MNTGLGEGFGENKFSFKYDDSKMLMRHCVECKRAICPGYLTRNRL